MALFENLDKQLSAQGVIYPYKDVSDEDWVYAIENGEKVPVVDYAWRDVGFVVDRPDMKTRNFVVNKSITHVPVKGHDRPVARFNPEFLFSLTGYKKSKGIIKGYVGIETKDKDGTVVPKPYDPEWLYKRFTAPGWEFLYSNFMKAYNEFAGVAKREDEAEDGDDENFS